MKLQHCDYTDPVLKNLNFVRDLLSEYNNKMLPPFINYTQVKSMVKES